MSIGTQQHIRLVDLPEDCLNQIFKLLDFNELSAISRTCTYLNTRIEDFRNRYPDEYNRKLKDWERRNDDGQPFNFEHDETDDTEGDGNFLVDYDDDIEDFLECPDGEDDLFDDDIADNDDIRSFGSNLEESDEDLY